MKYTIISLLLIIGFIPSQAQNCEQLFNKTRGLADGYRTWPNGTTIKVKFLRGGSADVRQKVENYAHQWTIGTGVRFQFVDSGPAEIRIAFDKDEGNNSAVGMGALSFTAGERTMNLQDLRGTPTEERLRRVAIHEFGHALGLKHEHQHPDCTIEWNTAAVYKYYLPWSKEQVDRNLFKVFSSSQFYRITYDRLSIMHYTIPAKLTLNNHPVAYNTFLSKGDKELVKRLYPEIDNDRDGYNSFEDCNDNDPTIHPNRGDVANDNIDNNCNDQQSIVNWQVSYNGILPLKTINNNSPLSKNIDQLLVGDFNGDGRADLFRANGVNWVYFDNGKILRFLEASSIVANRLQVGDFDGDGKADIFQSTGTKWRVAFGGKKPWKILKEYEVEPEKIKLGDFNGDGITDVAVISNQKVKYASGGVGNFISTNGQTDRSYGFLVGDFNGDGRDDLFNANGKEWRVLYGAAGRWQVLKNANATTDKLQVGYFNYSTSNGRDKKADIFRATGKRWNVWYDGKGAVQLLKDQTETAILLGDFTGSGVTDVFRIYAWGK